MVWEEVAGEGAKVPNTRAVDPIKSMEILKIHGNPRFLVVWEEVAGEDAKVPIRYL